MFAIRGSPNAYEDGDSGYYKSVDYLISILDDKYGVGLQTIRDVNEFIYEHNERVDNGIDEGCGYIWLNVFEIVSD